MWISKRTDYATRAVLALALTPPEGQLTLNELSERTATPRSVMVHVMFQLRTAGLVRAERGPSGGYRLNRDPGEITVEAVVRLFQGPIAPIDCATRRDPEPCPMEHSCALRSVWQEVRETTISILQATTFADLARRSGGRWTVQLDPPRLGR